MVTNKKDYAKSDDYKVLKHSLGNGLLTSEGDFWKKQRRIAQPAFHRESMKKLLDTMVDSTGEVVTQILKKDKIELTDEMNFLTLDIVTKCLFGTSLKADYKKIQSSVTIGNEYISEKIMSPFNLPLWVPTAKTLRYKKARKYSSSVLMDIINKRKEDLSEHQDLLSMLMHAEDEQSGERMSAQQLKDEAMTIFVAGHETTANALSWTFYLLSQNPEKLKILKEEVSDILKGGVPDFKTLKSLTYTQMVIEESMRLYPPAWSIGRKVIRETNMHGYRLKKNATLILDVYSLHRHPEYWENPEAFEPERFSTANKKNRHKNAYIPFGSGQRMCIGNNFAMMEMKIVLSMFVQAFDLQMSDTAAGVIPETLVTLRPKNGIAMYVKSDL
jgi:cytochrome P450